MTRKELNQRTVKAQETARARKVQEAKIRKAKMIDGAITYFELKCAEEAENGNFETTITYHDRELWSMLQEKPLHPFLKELSPKFDEYDDDGEDVYTVTLHWS